HEGPGSGRNGGRRWAERGGKERELADESRKRRQAGDDEGAPDESQTEKTHGRRNRDTDLGGIVHVVLFPVELARHGYHVGSRLTPSLRQLDQQEERAQAECRADEVEKGGSGNGRLPHADGCEYRARGDEHGKRRKPRHILRRKASD